MNNRHHVEPRAQLAGSTSFAAPYPMYSSRAVRHPITSTLSNTRYDRSGMNTNLVPQQGRWFLTTIGVKL
ncbi:MAG: hypothetical protein IJ898_03160 [Prevotella sp.]|nr:hypothetical protein [Prevotella sp.]